MQRTKKEAMNEAQQIESKCTMEFLRQCQLLGLEKSIPEYYFDPESKCRADRAFLKRRILVEFEGWGHRTKERFAKDLEKYNRAAILGWRLIRLTPRMVFKGESIEVLRQAFFPVANYLQRCMVCLEVSDSTIHDQCYQQIFDTKEDYKIYE
jgi:hypothetical protein